MEVKEVKESMGSFQIDINSERGDPASNSVGSSSFKNRKCCAGLVGVLPCGDYKRSTDDCDPNGPFYPFRGEMPYFFT